IYLNTLGSEREKQFFVGQLAQAVYRWMLRHPSPTPQALFYIDEVAPYLPPVRKPVCKDALALLFRQARKYGVCCLAATQSPGDAPELRKRLEQAAQSTPHAADSEAAPQQAPGGVAVGKAEVAVLAVNNEGAGTVGCCEIAIKGGGTGKVTALGGQTKVSKESIKVAWEAASQLQVELDLPRNFARRYDVTVLDTRLVIKKDAADAGRVYFTQGGAAHRV